MIRMWKGLKKNRTKRKLARNVDRSTISFSSRSATAYSEEDSYLDRSKHRSLSVGSLLSLEQSEVTISEENKLQMIPPFCLASEEGGLGKPSSIPPEVGIREDNDPAKDIYGNRIENCNYDIEDELNADENIGLDISGENNDVDVETVQVGKNDGTGYVSCRKISNNLPLALTSQVVPIEPRIVSTKKHCPLRKLASGGAKSRSGVTTFPVVQADNSDEENRSSVSFGTVEVHVHELKMDGGSSVPLRGPALGLGWNRVFYQKYDSVDDHRDRIVDAVGPRSLSQLQIPSSQRVNTLLEHGYTMRDIRSSTRDSGIVRTRRLQSSRYSARTKPFLAVSNMFGKVFGSN